MTGEGFNWLAVSVEFWPLVLALVTTCIAASVFTSGLYRLVAVIAAGLLALDLSAAAFFHRREATDGPGLTAAQDIDGLSLPAGADVTWTDSTHTHVLIAVLSAPAKVLGVTVDRLQRTVDDGWIVRLAGPQPIEGWTCRPDFVDLGLDGRLRTCTLAAPREWNGWTIPPGTLLRLDRPDQKVGVVFPESSSIMAPEIGRELPATGLVSINPDGSLDTVYFDADAPLSICGSPLWDTVQWDYDPATLGQGRNRPPIAVTGASPAGETVTLSLPGCAK